MDALILREVGSGSQRDAGSYPYSGSFGPEVETSLANSLKGQKLPDWSVYTALAIAQLMLCAFSILSK